MNSKTIFLNQSFSEISTGLTHFKYKNGTTHYETTESMDTEHLNTMIMILLSGVSQG